MINGDKRIKEVVMESVEKYLFEPNTKETQEKIKNDVVENVKEYLNLFEINITENK
jgi:L-lactate utilization protein LutB